MRPQNHKFGHFNTDGTEFIITDPRTPRAFDNFIWNDAVFSVIQQTGVGLFDYQYGDTEAVQLLTGIGRICDFDVFGREGLMSRLVYIRDNDNGEYWNVNWEPVKKEFENYRCIHGLGYSRIESETRKIASSFRIFVPTGKDPIELWTMIFRNRTDRRRNLSIFVYNQFLFKYKWDFESYGDMIFRKSYFSQELNAMIANKHPQFSPHPFQTGFMTADRPATGFDGSRDFFAGIYNLLNEPEAVIRGRCSNSEGSSDSTVGVLQFDLLLQPGGAEKMEMLLGATDSEKGISEMKEKYLGRSEEYFRLLSEEKKAMVQLNRIDTPDEHLNRMTNAWLKQETLYGATWCRWGWMGYRDIVQHGYGVVSFDPQRTRKILEKAFRHQYRSGMALRGWNPVDEKAYSDSALWLVFTLTAYLKETGEMDFLGEAFDYWDGGSDTVLGHVEQALNFLEANKGQHGLLLIRFGDWNDSLTAIGREGRGESVWLSMAYAEALRLMKELYEAIGHPEKTAESSNRYRSISNAVNEQAWDGDWYVRCFDDNGRPIGSRINEQGRIFLNTQSWAMISGIADDARSSLLIESADRNLLTPAGYMLLAPTFLKPDPHIGRISFLEPGICENGTVYSHVNAWMILGLLRCGYADKAYEIFRRITPGYVDGENDVKQKTPPYVYANGHYGPAHRNNAFQVEFTWITGSVAWHYNNMLTEMAGFRPGYDRFSIHPVIPSAWDGITLDRTFRSRSFHMKVSRGAASGVKVKLNGRDVLTGHILLSECEGENLLEVEIPVAT
jgi:cellobiose phosphorylase